MIVVIDTNVLVSSLLSTSGNEAKLVDLVQRLALDVAVSPAILTEYEKILRRPKFRFHAFTIERTMEFFSTVPLRVEPIARLTLSPDDSDNRFLECAEAARANFLVTGNKRHFPAHHGKTKVVTAREFFSEAEVSF